MKNSAIIAACTITAGLGLVLACTETSATSPPSSGGASGDQVDGCKKGCDKMKFFDCNSAAEQARCYEECGSATPNQIEVFTSCAQNSICDPECRTTITPKPAAGTSGATTKPSGGGATATSCTSACDKLVSCNFIKVGDKAACAAQCQKEAYQYQIDCVSKTDCSKMQATCGSISGGEVVIVTPGTSGGTSGTGTSGGTSGGLGDFEIKQCQSSCDGLQFFSCLDAEQHSDCRDLCTKATAAKRSTFESCETGSGSDCTKGMACYTQFKK